MPHIKTVYKIWPNLQNTSANLKCQNFRKFKKSLSIEPTAKLISKANKIHSSFCLQMQFASCAIDLNFFLFSRVGSKIRMIVFRATLDHKSTGQQRYLINLIILLTLISYFNKVKTSRN